MMTFLEYGFFWLTVLALFDWLYGRHFRAIVRAMLAPDDASGDNQTSVLKYFLQLLKNSGSE